MEINEDKISFLKDLKKLVDHFHENVDELNNKYRVKIIHPSCGSRWSSLIQNLKFGIDSDIDEIRKWIFCSIQNEITEKMGIKEKTYE